MRLLDWMGFFIRPTCGSSQKKEHTSSNYLLVVLVVVIFVQWDENVHYVEMYEIVTQNVSLNLKKSLILGRSLISDEPAFYFDLFSRNRKLHS